MSRDYFAVTDKLVNLEKIDKLCSRYSDCHYNRSPSTDSADGEIEKDHTMICSLAGPFDFQTSELRDLLDDTVQSKFLYEIGAPSNLTSDQEEIVLRVCCSLAEHGEGFAFDPQSDEVFYSFQPLEENTNITVQRDFPRIDILTLEFVFYPRILKNQASLLLEIIQSEVPYATPKRIDCLDFSSSRKLNNLSEFEELWDGQSTRINGGSLSWNGSSPFLNGSFGFEEIGRLDNKFAVPTLNTHQLTMNFNASELFQDFNQTYELVNSLIDKVTLSFETLYIAVYIQRNWGLGKNTLWLTTGESESLRVVSGAWIGLPRFPSWITWFGKDYSPLIVKSLEQANCQYEKLNEGLLLITNKTPLNTDQLKGIYPDFPKDLIIPASKYPKI